MNCLTESHLILLLLASWGLGFSLCAIIVAYVWLEREQKDE